MRDRGRDLRRRLGRAGAQPRAGAGVTTPRALPPASAERGPARPPARDRAGAARSATGAARSASRAWSTPTVCDVPLPLLVPLRGRGRRARAGHRRRPARLQPRRRAPARRVDDRQGDPGGAPAAAQAPPDGRALLQGLSVLQHVRREDRRRPGAPGERPPAALRRAAARARLPRGREGRRRSSTRTATSCAASAAAASSRRRCVPASRSCRSRSSAPRRRCRRSPRSGCSSGSPA